MVCTGENLKRLKAALTPFTLAPHGVELRHRSWSDDLEKTDAVLARAQAAWAFIDEPKFPTSVKQDITVQGNFASLRLHGRTLQKWWKPQEAWERYDYFYHAEIICRLAGRFKVLAGKSPGAKFYGLFNNHAHGQAVANALMLRGALDPESRVEAPRGLIEAFPELKDFVAGESSDELC